MVQAGTVMNELAAMNPGLRFELKIIKTTGDKILDAPLSKIGDKGLFTKEIEKELLEGDIDCAVHSMKDLPTVLPPGCAIGATTMRIDTRDSFLSNNGHGLDGQKKGAVIATGSLRRKAQLMRIRPDFKIVDVRGNVNSRIAKLRGDSGLDGLILASAGLHRLGLVSEIAEFIPVERIIPAVGQAALALEVRATEPEIMPVIAGLNHPDTMIAISCERGFLAALEGGCQVPIAGHARIIGGNIVMHGLVASLDGSIVIDDRIEGRIDQPVETGKALAERLIARGAGAILDEVYGRS